LAHLAAPVAATAECVEARAAFAQQQQSGASAGLLRCTSARWAISDRTPCISHRPRLQGLKPPTVSKTPVRGVLSVFQHTLGFLLEFLAHCRLRCNPVVGPASALHFFRFVSSGVCRQISVHRATPPANVARSSSLYLKGGLRVCFGRALCVVSCSSEVPPASDVRSTSQTTLAAVSTRQPCGCVVSSVDDL
jgi:hypothetical protein